MERLGRYRIEGVLGRGGMGVVYAGWDPDLQRKVAIKVLGDAKISAGHARLVREARAMAKLSHPNVITAYEVGHHDGLAFIAMELVDGTTLAEWLRTPRLRRDILRVFCDAARGLVAAHAVGLIHRDFKPQNVLVRRDGHAVVTDFGLARVDLGTLPRTPVPSDAVLASLVGMVGGTDDSTTGSASTVPERPGDVVEPNSPTLPDVHDELTRTGAVLGTPAYMAPEQYRGVADARSDQFAFCVALWDALTGEPPFRDSGEQRLVAIERGPSGKLRGRLRGVLARGLAVDPAQRWPSMSDLLVRIEPRSRAIAVVAAAVVVAAAGTGVLAWRTHGPAPCNGIDERLSGVWDGDARAAVHAAFIKTKLPHAERAFAALDSALDARASAWTAAVTDSCRATRVRGEQPDEVLALRQDCFDDRLGELRALVKVLEDADPAIVDKADGAVSELDSMARCANVAALRQTGRPPPALEIAVAELQRELATAKAQLIAGRFLPTLVATQRIIDQAAVLHWDPIASEALRARATTLFAVGNTDEGIHDLELATWAGMRGRRDDIVAGSALALGMMTADTLGKPDVARVWIDLGAAAVARYGDDPALAVTLYHCSAVAAAARGDLNAALEFYDKLWTAASAEYGKNSTELAVLEDGFAATLAKAGAFGKAVPHYERAIALATKTLGEEHGEIAKMLSGLGLCYHHIGELDKAHATLARSLAIREKLFGKNSPVLVASLDNFAEVLGEEGDHAAAITSVEHARTLAAVLPGRAHPDYHQVATDEGQILVAAGELVRARGLYDETVALERQTGSKILPQTLTALANLALAEHKWDEAARSASEAIAAFEAQGGPDQPELWEPLTALARATLAQHDPAKARTLLERALAIADHAHIPEHDLRATRAVLAEASR